MRVSIRGVDLRIRNHKHSVGYARLDPVTREIPRHWRIPTDVIHIADVRSAKFQELVRYSVSVVAEGMVNPICTITQHVAHDGAVTRPALQGNRRILPGKGVTE